MLGMRGLMDNYCEKVKTLIEMFRDIYSRGAIIGFDDDGSCKGRSFCTEIGDLDYDKLKYGLNNNFYLQTKIILYNGEIIYDSEEFNDIEDKIVIELGDYIR